MSVLIKNKSLNDIFLWKLCFIENNSFLCIVKLKKTKNYEICNHWRCSGWSHGSRPTEKSGRNG